MSPAYTVDGRPIESRVAALEALRNEDCKRLDRVETAVDQIRGIAWTILGMVGVQTIVTVVVLFARKVFP